MPGDVSFGLHERIVTRGLAEALRERDGVAQREALDSEDSHLALAHYLYTLLTRALRALPASERLDRQVAISNRLIELLRGETPHAFDGSDDDVQQPAELLLALVEPDPSGLTEPRPPARPAIPLAQTALLTNARGEPSIGAEISAELESADNVDLLIAFVKWYGVRLIKDALGRVIERGGRVRVITTTYMAASEGRAIDALAALGADVKVAYESQTTRLHAKAWLFKRNSGYTTGFIGSSNLSKSALVDGVEWNVRISGIDNPNLVQKFQATFDTYWESDLFESYDPDRDGDRLATALQATLLTPEIGFAHIEIRPYPHQQRILEELAAERERHNRWRNLVVAATGTGKTVVAGLDYRRLRERLHNPSLLFVAHRKEILTQSRATFRAILRDGSFGELYVDGHRPEEWRHVFASIQSLASLGPTTLDPTHFDVVIVDEFHHAAAPTYRELLDHVTPHVLLGLTATPERADGEDITARFGGRFASELRLWEALEQSLLVPFHYFGVHDDIDLHHLEWRRGGYQTADLENLYTGNDARVAKVLEAVGETVPDPGTMRALGFCVSIAHAEYMAERFRRAGVASEAISSTSTPLERDGALRRLRNRETNVVFAVDLFNEGVDVPEIDTVLFLRPTESATVFLQQLGRGLRHADDKACLTVLDFIGQQHRRFRFDRRYRALTGGSRRDVERQIDSGFPFLPAGCHISLDCVAQKVVLDNVRQALGTTTRDLERELRELGDISLERFLDETGLEVEELYRSGRAVTQLRRRAFGLDPDGPEEDKLCRALGRLLHVDDPERIALWGDVLQRPDPPRPGSERDRRLFTMLHFALWGTAKTSLDESFERLWPYHRIRQELVDLFAILDDRAPHIGEPLERPVGVPLHVHCRYSREEILAAFGASTAEAPRQLREGTYFDAATETDIFFVTLEKTEKHYSPSTMYQDYALSPRLFHWESQSTTTERSPTGRRFVSGAEPILFARERRTNDAGTTMAYLCLGPASYVRHEGERPMAITWRLRHDLPADFYEVARIAAG